MTQARTLIEHLRLPVAGTEFFDAYIAAGESLETKTQYVPIKKLVCTQGEVNEDRIIAIKRSMRKRRLSPIEVIPVGDRMVILNGHHRAVAAILAGRKRLRARAEFFAPFDIGRMHRALEKELDGKPKGSSQRT